MKKIIIMLLTLVPAIITAGIKNEDLLDRLGMCSSTYEELRENVQDDEWLDNALEHHQKSKRDWVKGAFTDNAKIFKGPSFYDSNGNRDLFAVRIWRNQRLSEISIVLAAIAGSTERKAISLREMMYSNPLKRRPDHFSLDISHCNKCKLPRLSINFSGPISDRCRTLFREKIKPESPQCQMSDTMAKKIYKLYNEIKWSIYISENLHVEADILSELF